MAASKTYRTFISIALAAIGAELGIFLAGACLVPVVDTALRTIDPPFAVLWVAAGLVHACSAVVAGWVGVKAGWRLALWLGRPVRDCRDSDAEARLCCGSGAAA